MSWSHRGFRRCQLAAVAGLGILAAGPSLGAAVSWRQVLDQPAPWYATEEARTVADNVLLHQDRSGGWPKNRDMTQPPSPDVLTDRETDAPTIDNGATWTQLRVLVRVHASRPEARWREAILRGLDYLLDAQYENGGWPQFFPLRRGYYSHITFNDDAMASVLDLLQDVAAPAPEFAFVDDARRARAADAVKRGIACILQCQVIVAGRRTAWCAQHDEHTFAPVPARSFEPVALSGQESVGIVRFLMRVEDPSPEVIEAIEAAVAWFREVEIRGVRLDRPPAPDLPHGHDLVAVADPDAPPQWARFYEIGTNRPIFSGRDGIVRYALAEIEGERRGGYNWYTREPAKLLERDYPQWRARLGRVGDTAPAE